MNEPIFPADQPDPSVLSVNGELLRRETLWTWGAYWFVNQGNRWTAWRLEVNGGYQAIPVGTAWTLADALQMARNDQGRRNGPMGSWDGLTREEREGN